MKIQTKILCLFFIFTLYSCSKHKIEPVWWLRGENIHLEIDLKEKKTLQFFEKKNLIFEAKIEEHQFSEEEKLKVKATITKVGEKKEYQLKYQQKGELIFWFEKQKNYLKMVCNKIFNKPYYFSLSPFVANTTAFRILSGFEREGFKSSLNFKEAKKDHVLEILLNKPSLMSDEAVLKEEARPTRAWVREKKYGVLSVIKTMEDYLTDMDFSTFWGTEDFWGTELEALVFDSLGKPLKKPAKIRAIYLNTGNIDKPARYFDYHRAKEIEISFSQDYQGGLGTSRGNYNTLKYKVLLPDTQEEKILVFFEPILAYAVRIRFKDFYMGYQNALAIYDFNLFLDND